MIYTVIKNMDCPLPRQSIEIIPNSVIKYIESARNEKTKKERLYAYTTLFFSLRELYKITDCSIARTEYGKPYLVSPNGTSPLPEISISHSDGIVAVSLSDEGEIGVDVQNEIDTLRAEKLMERFFRGVRTNVNFQPVSYLSLNTDSDGRLYLSMDETRSESELGFTHKWALCESALKCKGGGFSDIGQINNIIEAISADVRTIEYQGKTFAISTAKYNKPPVM